jgi:hypothetical protein
LYSNPAFTQGHRIVREDPKITNGERLVPPLTSFFSESKTRSQSSVVPYIAVRGTVSHNNNRNDLASKQCTDETVTSLQKCSE